MNALDALNPRRWRDPSERASHSNGQPAVPANVGDRWLARLMATYRDGGDESERGSRDPFPLDFADRAPCP